MGAGSVNEVGEWVAWPPTYLAAEGSDLGGVEAEVRRHLGELRQCYDERLLAHPGLSGEIVIHWGINPDGTVEEQCITSEALDEPDPGLVACVNALVAGSRFPVGKGSLAVEFPFTFSPAETPGSGGKP